MKTTILIIALLIVSVCAHASVIVAAQGQHVTLNDKQVKYLHSLHIAIVDQVLTGKAIARNNDTADMILLLLTKMPKK